MRISDCSSDVCSSDLVRPGKRNIAGQDLEQPSYEYGACHCRHQRVPDCRDRQPSSAPVDGSQASSVIFVQLFGLAACGFRLTGLVWSRLPNSSLIFSTLSSEGLWSRKLEPGRHIAPSGMLCRSEEQQDEPQTLMRTLYLASCLNKK